ncbi:DUF6760 family protein [Streptomyces sp. NPDC002935]|uniref:T4 family baseplate hub assembly chaperone n=1 Tax=unclassified Streptomyces TaxID=2593676 RepID=UPI003318390A
MEDELPGGYWDAAGQLHRTFELSPLTGYDEELLAGVDGAALVSTVLSRCVRRLGTISPVPAEVAADLLVADRLYLLLRLRRATFGDAVNASLICPWPECGRRISLAFSVDDVPVVRSASPAATYTVALGDPSVGEAEFRLPTGADQEALADEVDRNEARALTGLLTRCLLRLGTVHSPASEQITALPSATRTEIERRMHDVAPRVEQTLETTCPECGRALIAPFDIHRFLFGDLRTDARLLYQEVHYLAFHYHWSERDILDMPRDRRRVYIDAIAETIGAMNDGT